MRRHCRLTEEEKGGMLDPMKSKWCSVLAAGALAFAPLCSAVEVILAGGVALKSWEHYRGSSAHDNWWANFVRASTVRIDMARRRDPQTKIVWIVFRPPYITRGREEGKDLISLIRQEAASRKVQLVFADTANQVFQAINKAGSGKERITSFYYFGHSNAHAFMLDYSNGIIAVSKQWIHEKDLELKLRREAFAPDAECRSFGCYTGNSMSQVWFKALGIPLWGNTESTRYQPVGNGCLPIGAGTWVK